MTGHEEEILRARTFMKAAVPLLEEVVAADPKKQKMIAKWNCAIQFKIQSEEPAVHLLFEKGTLKVVQSAHPKPAVTLGFKNLKHFNDFMVGDKLILPKISGFAHPILIAKTLMMLMALKMLKPSFKVNTDEMKILKIKMLLLMVTRALEEMAAGGDEYVVKLTKSQKNKILEWTIDQKDDLPAAYIVIDMGTIKAKSGRSKKRPYLAMDFKDIDSALKVLTGEAGPVEAQGTGMIVPRGTAEFGMKAGSLMKRVENFLMPTA